MFRWNHRQEPTKPVALAERFAAHWAVGVERFGRHRPMSGQKSFDWVEDDHPRETEEHDGKKPGEFAPKRYQEWDSQRHPRDGDKPTSYLTGHSSPPVREAAKKNAGLGLLITPYTQHYVGHAEDYSHIALDNGVYSEFTGTQPFSPERFRALIAKVASKPELAGKTQFVVAPDVVGDWEKTLERSKPWLAEIRKSGLPVAFAAQDGIEKHPEKIPWDDFDVLFIGGSTAWKLGFNPIDGVFRPSDAQLRKSGFNDDFTKMLKQARAKGKRIHMGRVNSWKRAEMANYGMQLDTMDGNFIGVAPDKNLPQVLSWLDAITRGMKQPGQQQDNPRAWTNNGDGTWTTPSGTVWKKASKDGEISPVNGKPYRGGELMPIHGKSTLEVAKGKGGGDGIEIVPGQGQEQPKTKEIKRRVGSGKREVEPYVWEVPPTPEHRSIFRQIAGTHARWVKRNVPKEELRLEPNPDVNRDYLPDDVGGYSTKELADMWNAGERWFVPKEKPSKHSAQAEVDRYGRVKPMAGQASFDFDRQEPAPATKATPTPPPAPEPENEPEPTSPLAIKLKRYLELQQKAVRQGLGERRTNLLK
jgi:hypothetical protein